MAPNCHQTFKPFQLYWNESPSLSGSTCSALLEQVAATPPILCQHPSSCSVFIWGSHRPMWLQVGDNGDAVGKESHRGGAHSKILALYPKGFLVGLAPEDTHIPWQCRPTWEDILCSSLSCMLGRRTGQPGFGQAQGRTTLESNCSGQLSLTLRMNFNSCLIGSWLRESFPSCGSHPRSLLNQMAVGPFKGTWVMKEHGWIHGDKLATSNPHRIWSPQANSPLTGQRGNTCLAFTWGGAFKGIISRCYRTLQLLRDSALFFPVEEMKASVTQVKIRFWLCGEIRNLRIYLDFRIWHGERENGKHFCPLSLHAQLSLHFRETTSFFLA